MEMPMPQLFPVAVTGRRAAILAFALGVTLPALAACQSQTQPTPDAATDADHAVRAVTVVDGLQHPWGLAFLPGGEMLVTERPGRLRVVRNGQLVPDPVAGVPEVVAQGQGGLLDVAVHPDFASNRLVYLSYSKRGPNGSSTAVARGRYENGRLENVQDIFVAEAWGTGGQHFGSRLLFDRAGYLYVTVGDRGDSPNRGEAHRAQNRADHAGSTLRLHDDGRVPQDNPFVGQQGVRPELFTYGNRNAQGMALHPSTGEVWQTEHGPRGGDELNLMRAGANYGWPLVSHGVNYSGAAFTERTEAPGMEPSVLQWTPSIATSGLAFYTGDVFPGWRGSVFTGALVGQHLRRVVLDGTRVVRQEELLTDYGQRIRDVRTGPDGHLYLLTDSPQGRLVRLEPAS
jgi:aldose sugar dehydrogenase